jgi:hypothetical protein
MRSTRPTPTIDRFSMIINFPAKFFSNSVGLYSSMSKCISGKRIAVNRSLACFVHFTYELSNSFPELSVKLHQPFVISLYLINGLQQLLIFLF